MSDNHDWHLCCGLVFALLANIKNNEPNPRTFRRISEPEMLGKLLCVLNPDINSFRYPENGNIPNQIKAVTRSIKVCDGSVKSPFNVDDTNLKKDAIEYFKDNRVKALSAMKEFLSGYIVKSESARKIVVSALLSLLFSDDNIPSETIFFLDITGTPISKSALLTALENEKMEFCMESFLLGIWYYSFTQVVSNVIGKSTYADLFPKITPYSPRTLHESDELTRYTSMIQFREYPIEEIKTEKTDNLTVKDTPSDAIKIPADDHDLSSRLERIEKLLDNRIPKPLPPIIEPTVNPNFRWYIPGWDDKNDSS